MKIRIKDNSVRIRLTKPEVEQFGTEGYLEAQTEFGNHAFIYALSEKTSGDTLSAGFEGNKMTMYVPTVMKNEWVATSKVGYSTDMPLSNGNTLFLLLEKDFKCIDSEVPEDQSDNYDNPHTHC